MSNPKCPKCDKPANPHDLTYYGRCGDCESKNKLEICPSCDGLKTKDQEVCIWCKGEPISLGTYVPKDVYDKLQTRCAELERELEEAREVIKVAKTMFPASLADFPAWAALKPTWSKFAEELQKALTVYDKTSHPQEPREWVVVKKEDLSYMKKQFDNYVPGVIKTTNWYKRLKAALEGK